MTFSDFIDAYFFQKIPAWGFGLMRIAWATTVLLILIAQWNDVLWYYSDTGFLPAYMMSLILRPEYRFSIFDFIPNPADVFMFYLILLMALAFVIAGYRTRIMTVISVVLLFSFHERNPLPLGEGDTLLRVIGLLLLVAPGTQALSMDRALEWEKNPSLPRAMMPVWPYRLLLWQLIVLNVSSAWAKLLGTTWVQGNAVYIALQHPHFARWPLIYSDLISVLSPLISLLTIVWSFLWLLLLIPQTWFHLRLKRILIISGFLLHLGIVVLFEIGIFPYAMAIAYLGLLTDADIPLLMRIRDRMTQVLRMFFIRNLDWRLWKKMVAREITED